MRSLAKRTWQFLAQKRVRQVGALSFGMALVNNMYFSQWSLFDIQCQDENKQTIDNQIQPVQQDSNNIEASATPEDSQDIDTEPTNLFEPQILSRYGQISDLLIHHKTQSECIILLPGCSESTKSLLFRGLSEKTKKKHLKIYLFDPSQKPSATSAKEEKKEQEKTNELHQKLSGQEFFGINSAGDLRFFSWNGMSKSTEYQRAMNFFSPPRTIQENQFPEFVNSIQTMKEDARIIVSYIPEEKVYEANLPKISTFDLYRQGRIKNITELEKRFRNLSYEYIEPNTEFLIIRNLDIAQTVSIGKDDVGDVFIVKKKSIQNNNESNWVFHGEQYLHQRIEWDPNTDKSFQLTQQDILAKLYQKSFSYVNTLNIEADLRHFLVSAEQLKLKKILLYYSAEASDETYESKLLQKLISLKKNIPDNDFGIVFTKNPLILQKYFHVIPDKLTDTVRLLDFSKSQEKLGYSTSVYPEWTVITPYKQVDASSQGTIAPSEEDKKIQVNTGSQSSSPSQPIQLQSCPPLDDTSIYEKEADDSRRFKYEGKATRNRLIGFVKKCLRNEEQQYDECEDVPALQKTNYLNSAIFNQQILNPNIYNDSTSETINIVYFFKPGCPNCSAVSKALNVFIDDLSTVQQDLKEFQNGTKTYNRYEENKINAYRLENFDKFNKKINVHRYNIYNECPDFPSPSAAPLLFFFGKNNKLKPLQADLLKDRVNINDPEKVSRYLFKKIDLIDI